ncbi:hypothetical protein N7452_002295 [Penicillium brevicompactum]|uniref:Uncharacterized protein n=1 Tax=Penicillium brevicompactum TaxID=5074 RepID=A0A9W9USM6_PENBR|nr:hypothetical protein N7452_002295 [Penicillium brevicompactum]
MERSREQWISGARSHDGTCIVYLLKIVLEWEAVAREAVDVVINARACWSTEDLLLVTAL